MLSVDHRPASNDLNPSAQGKGLSLTEQAAHALALISLDTKKVLDQQSGLIPSSTKDQIQAIQRWVSGTGGRRAAVVAADELLRRLGETKVEEILPRQRQAIKEVAKLVLVKEVEAFLEGRAQQMVNATRDTSSLGDLGSIAREFNEKELSFHEMMVASIVKRIASLVEEGGISLGDTDLRNLALAMITFIGIDMLKIQKALSSGKAIPIPLFEGIREDIQLLDKIGGTSNKDMTDMVNTFNQLLEQAHDMLPKPLLIEGTPSGGGKLL